MALLVVFFEDCCWTAVLCYYFTFLWASLGLKVHKASSLYCFARRFSVILRSLSYMMVVDAFARRKLILAWEAAAVDC